MVEAFAKDLGKYERRGYSQTVEDGVLEGVFERIGTTNKFFVEFGAWDGVHLSNTANLRLHHHWTGLLLEGNEEKAKQFPYVKHAFITAENINDLFQQHGVPPEFDLLSIDIDGNDYWVWKAVDEKRFCPRVVVVEYNFCHHDQARSIAIKYDKGLNSVIPSINYFGATIPAFYKLGKLKGYSLIRRINLHNLVFVRTDLLHKDDQDIPVDMFLNKDKRAVTGTNWGVPDGPTGKRLHCDQMTWHWNEYADTNIVALWPQDYSKEWVDV
jgi:hypothetical protein